jgi:hypothetical protein
MTANTLSFLIDFGLKPEQTHSLPLEDGFVEGGKITILK